jgi:glycosyltransferase involved in cell wall biosynthesis
MKDQKTVLVLTTSFPLYEGIAVGIHVLEKCRHLVKRGIKVKVIAPHHDGAAKHEKIDGIEIYRFQYYWPSNQQKLAYGAGIPTNIRTDWHARFQFPLFLLCFLMKAIQKAPGADIVHCHWSLAGFIGVILRTILKKKIVFMMHGAEVFVLGKSPFLRFILKRVDFLICNSSFTEQKTLDIYPVKKHRVISPGVDVNRFFPQRNVRNLRQDIGISDNDIFVLTIGKFIPRKGIEDLIKSFDIIINERGEKDIQLRIGGRGPLMPAYENLIRQYNLGKNVQFLKYISDEDIPSYFTESDIFALTPIIDAQGDTEGLGVVFLEANACETPVIGTRVGGVVDAITDGRNGLLLSPQQPEALAEAIIRLMRDPELRATMGKNGRELVIKRFNWPAISTKIESVYRQVLLSE